MKLTLEEQSPVLDMDIPVVLKVRDLMKLNQILTRTYDEEERLRETLSPILQEIRGSLQAVELDPEWHSLVKWDSEAETLSQATERLKKHLKRIKRALVKNRNLRLRYCMPGSGAIIRSTVIPLELWKATTGWLLRAFSYQHGEEQTFRVERILKAKQKPCGKAGNRSPIMPAVLSEAIEEEMASLATDAECEDALLLMEGEEPSQVFAEDAVVSMVSGAPEKDMPVPGGASEPVAVGIHDSKHPHYSLPGKNPHRSGLPNRLDRLIKRVERKTE